MDEWFVNLELRQTNGLTGVVRVPGDQTEKLKELPIIFAVDGEVLRVAWHDAGDDEEGRRKLELTSNAPSGFSELKITVPPRLLDENQSLVGFLKVAQSDPTTVLVPPAQSATYSLESAAQTQNSVGGFVELGLTHIIEGYDHLLFLFCLLIAGGTLRHFLVVVTAFTLGHSITLSASVLDIVSLPSQLTETLIALSIVVAATLNIPWLKKSVEPEESDSVKTRGLLAGGFGLVHGLGFAGVLREIGIQGAGVAAPLLGFNLGVEIGQLILVALFYPILLAVNKWNKRIPFLIGCSVIAALVGAYWTFERMGALG